MCVVCLQEVEPNSPAAQAGLVANTDYIIGTDRSTNEVSGGGGLCMELCRFQNQSVTGLSRGLPTGAGLPVPAEQEPGGGA